MRIVQNNKNIIVKNDKEILVICLGALIGTVVYNVINMHFIR